MNIYIHIEIESREFDSKLLLAIIAASKGHHVFLSDIENIEKNLRRKFLVSGIFHTKSVTPDKPKTERHQAFLDRGCKITSIDEEGGLVFPEYDRFAKRRFSDQSIAMTSALFFWGKNDFESIKRLYPKHESKIFMTGSPRVDLWKSVFSEYWQLPLNAPNRPYLLFIGNMKGVNGYAHFYETIQNQTDWDYLKRDPNVLKELFYRGSDQFKLTYKFIEAIKFLSKNCKDYDIILRPHPTENIKSWTTYLKGIPNVFVTRDGPINVWLKNAFCIVHNGDTSGFEAIAANKPLITYKPVEQSLDWFTNKLGDIVENKEDLLTKVNDLFNTGKVNNQEHSKKLLADRIFQDKNELSAQKIVKVWESLDDISFSKKNNWLIIRIILNLMEINGNINRTFKKIFSRNQKTKENFKFPPFNKKDILNRFNKLNNILKIDKKIECKVLSKRTILIKPFKK